ncbi:ATP-binding protein [Actinoplanes sp. KI2]|uniref:ATP-binding protein n=1 Tax=Actinoplanes sp. KI2 TaxID=2983315 RepID=UPI0021D57DDB|nr:ATP-binding protein [Actinoplanes sp. KI2]MCU7723047.1 ATP-binding protein [Actinoplanes sp. KI2]
MSSLPASVPYPRADEICRWTLASFGELRGLRADLRAAVDVAAAGPDVTDRMTVVANELATNALRYGLPPAVVRLLSEGDRLIIDVSDHDREAEPRVAEDRPLGAGGLGLQLTRTFAIDVGWYSTELTKHVWASFPR